MAKDISAADGALVVAEAKTWKGTPYKLVGAGSIKGDGGDCSGSTWRVYTAVGFAYDYRNSATLDSYVVEKKKFRKLGAAEAKQEGDLLLWSDHMAVYTSFASDAENAVTGRVTAKGAHWDQVNDMWTATHTGGPAYQANKMSYFKITAPQVYRYQK